MLWTYWFGANTGKEMEPAEVCICCGVSLRQAMTKITFMPQGMVTVLQIEEN